jgi:phosphatidylinositol kinase/protein kinase (PI-3  family)
MKIKFEDTVPFRLTRNLQTFFNGISVDGIFNSVMTATAMCLDQYQDQLKHHLAIFLRDDLIAWQSTDEAAMDQEEEDKQKDTENKKKLKSTVEANTADIIEKIKALVVSPAQPHFSEKVFLPLFLFLILERMEQLLQQHQSTKQSLTL